jgi:pyroglutamyl-peptidase
MKNDILITSFTTWKPHQTSNAADDLLQRFIDEKGDVCHYLRKIEVDFALAPRRVLERFDALLPKVVVCCGMAEERTHLNIESQAVLNEKPLKTGIDLAQLTEGLSMTCISHDAGRFVCNTLYYRTLEHLRSRGRDHHCLFVHVPLLSDANAPALTEDFTTIIERLAAI